MVGSGAACVRQQHLQQIPPSSFFAHEGVGTVSRSAALFTKGARLRNGDPFENGSRAEGASSTLAYCSYLDRITNSPQSPTVTDALHDGRSLNRPSKPLRIYFRTWSGCRSPPTPRDQGARARPVDSGEAPWRSWAVLMQKKEVGTGENAARM